MRHRRRRLAKARRNNRTDKLFIKLAKAYGRLIQINHPMSYSDEKHREKIWIELLKKLGLICDHRRMFYSNMGRLECVVCNSWLDRRAMFPGSAYRIP